MKFLRSVRLSSVLIGYLILFFIVSTLLPQDPYRHFTSSLFFVIPCVFFFINLLSCAVYRILQRIKEKKPIMPGPDIVHIGILLLIIGALYSGIGRKDKLFTMAPGDEMALFNKYEMLLKNFDFEKYPDGRPKSWASSVIVALNGTNQAGYVIEVNRPLKIDKYTIYQQSYSTGYEVVLKNRDNKTELLTASMKIGGKTVRLKNADESLAVIEIAGEKTLMEKTIRPGSLVEGLRVREIRPYYLSGLMVVYDPGIPLVIFSFFLICAGLLIIFYQKKGEA
jgi:hypothetical protein